MSQKQLDPELSKIIQILLTQLIPDIEILVQDNLMIDYYQTNHTEPKLINNYTKFIEILPRTPTYHSKSPRVCDWIEIDNEINRIAITSSLKSYDYNFTEKQYEWNFTKENQLDFYKNLKSDTLNSNWSNIIVRISDFNKIYKFSIKVYILDSPMNSNISNNHNFITLDIDIANPNNMKHNQYLHHDVFSLIFNSDKAFHPHSNRMCICRLQDLGTDKCPYEKYINKKSNQQLFQEISDEIYDNKESFQEGNYLKIMNNLMELQENIK